MCCVTLGGWAQPPEGLEEILPGNMALDYSRYKSFAELEATVRDLYSAPELAVGWSLGGQLAVRLTAAGAWRPKRLVVIAGPYQFVADEAMPDAMPPEIFATFRQNYAEDTCRTVSRFTALIAKGDANAREVLERLPKTPALDTDRWMPWLDALADFSARRVNFSGFPPTLLIHGRSDAIVNLSQAAAYREALPHAETFWLEHAGHAPHLHDGAAVSARIGKFMGVHAY